MIQTFSSYKSFTSEELEKIELSPEGGRACYTFFEYFICEQVSHTHPTYPHKIGISVISKNHLTKFYLFPPQGQTLEDFLGFYIDRYLKSSKHLEKMETHLSRLRVFARKTFTRESRDYSSEELKTLLKSYMDLYWNMMVCAGNLRMIDRAVIEKLRTLFRGVSDVDTALAIAALPIKCPFNAEERLAILDVSVGVARGTLVKGTTKYQKKVQKLVDSYAWSEMGYFDEPPKVFADYEKEILDFAGKDPELALVAMKNQIAEEEHSQARLLEGLDKKGKAIVQVASWATYLKDYYKCAINELEYRGEWVLAEIAKKSGVSLEYIKDLVPDEIFALLDGKKPDEGFVKERVRQNVCIGAPDGKLVFLTGDDAEKFIAEHASIAFSSQKEFKGRVASRGNARGIARVVLEKKDFGKLRDGDILVVTNTSPDFVSIIKKSGAVVAEEGGLTAHVSVVSREFGIPCVVGIENATEIFKDGDQLEVDAERGVVRKLS
ncbi:MAG: hypothetical protein A2664_03640 [Candidatus Taylorbacteria bacterium RIFCSPHIGHO2_01_FULL_46_22b]|uniref:PEP-utilising enzyme mobile domain-containing protein n=1 Tax=Candidatus Taylorbacteria bacterium RIFCSPHIGHO2_01_FULL_46_22b TaxID=1802301 RepID=A0A1G2M1J4_9BACT|nr:MAG: hypothetical protein A2664_03640 [Candidatus Taylorbacteria bacterium RIFCSPHIGHO2_01_FULL_46_22b]